MLVNQIKGAGGRLVFAVLLAAACMCRPAMAAGWQQAENQAWRYEEDGGFASGWRQIDGTWYYFDRDGIMQTGWVRAAEDGLWYCLDSATGAWVSRPVLDDTAVVHLMENQIQGTGYYGDEDRELVVTVDYRQGSLIYVSLRAIDGPNQYTTLNNYRVHRKTGKVSADAGGGLELYP